MKELIFLSIAFSFLSCIINNEQVLAIDGPEVEKISITDPGLQPPKYCDSEKCNPTIILLPGSKIDMNKDAKDITKSMKRDGTNENVVITLMSRIASVQRLELIQLYKRQKRGSLPYHVKRENSGRFEDSMVAVMTPLPVYYAEELQRSITPAGIDEPTLVEILCTVNNFGVKSISEYYERLFKKPLKDAVGASTKGAFQKVMGSLLEGKRAEDAKVDNAKAVADAKALNGPDAKPWNTKPPFSDIFGTRSYPHLRQVFIEYKKVSGREIEDDIKKEFPGTESQGLLEMTKVVRSKLKFFADKLEESMRHDSGAKMDRPLIRILVSRSEIDLADIKVEYTKLHIKSLEHAVASKTGSFYRRVLTNMIRGNIPEATGAAPPPGK